MFDAAKFTMFIAVSWALIIAPGPDMLYVITRGMHRPRIFTNKRIDESTFVNSWFHSWTVRHRT